MEDKTFLNLAVLTISDTRTLETDTSGATLAALASEEGHTIIERGIVIDSLYAIRAAVSNLIAREDIQVILLTGGTGITDRDVTPEAVTPLLDRKLDGFGELFRMISYEEIGTAAIQSRALAGSANGKLIFCMPGSTNACRTAWIKILTAQLSSSTKPCSLVQLFERMKTSC